MRMPLIQNTIIMDSKTNLLASYLRARLFMFGGAMHGAKPPNATDTICGIWGLSPMPLALASGRFKFKFLLFVTPKKAHPCSEPRLLHHNPCGRLGCSWLVELKNDQNSGVNSDVCICRLNKTTVPIWIEFCTSHDGRYPRRNHLRKFWRQSVAGLGMV